MDINQEFIDKIEKLLDRYDNIIKIENEKPATLEDENYTSILNIIGIVLIASSTAYFGYLIYRLVNNVKLKLTGYNQRKPSKIVGKLTIAKQFYIKAKTDILSTIYFIIDMAIEVKEMTFLIAPIFYSWIRKFSIARMYKFIEFHWENSSCFLSKNENGKIEEVKMEIMEKFTTLSKQLEEMRINQIDKGAIEEKLETGLEQMNSIMSLVEEVHENKVVTEFIDLPVEERERIILVSIKMINCKESDVRNMQSTYPNALTKIERSGYQDLEFVPSQLEIYLFLLSLTVLSTKHLLANYNVSEENADKFSTQPNISDYVLDIIWNINGLEREM